MEVVVTFDLTHHRLLAPVIVTVADHFAVERNAVHDEVDMFMLGVRVTRRDVLVRREAHPGQIVPSDLGPRRVTQTLAWRCR